MDKKALKKHHFWILLGVAVLLIPIALAGAVWGVGGEATAKAKTIDDKLKALTGQKPKGKEFRDTLDSQKTVLQSQKTRVWKDAYAAQAGLIRWPSALDQLNTAMESPNLDTPAKLYFGDPIEDRDRAVFRTNDVYLAEYDRLPAVIAPTEFNGKSWQQVLRYVPAWEKLPSSEEVWLALEDLCVEREILRDIDAVNQMLARFLPVPLPIKAPAEPKSKAPEEAKRYEEDVKRYAAEKGKYDGEKAAVDKELKEAFKPQQGEFAGRFISPYWQLDLVVGRSASGKAGELQFRGKLTNTSGRRQNVARIEFKIWLRNPDAGPDVAYAILPIQSEYLAAGASVEFKETRVGPNEPSLRVYKVEQKLDTRYVPVKRVDQLKLGYPSHRFANRAPVTSAFSDEEIKKIPPAPTAAAGDAGIAAGGAMAAMAGGMDPTSVTPNGLLRKRYIERSDQVRRMAIAVTLIVDQGHVQDVIRALSNSRLRFQNTQVHYERFRGTISLGNPELIAGGDVAPGNAGVVAPRLPEGGVRGKLRSNDLMPEDERPAAGRGGLRMGPAAPGNAGAPSAEDESSSNLVELTVYGLISLYEQFPPKTPGDAAAQPAPADGQPPAAAPAQPPPAGMPMPPPAAGLPIPPKPQ
jgi:hypothetical protein